MQNKERKPLTIVEIEPFDRYVGNVMSDQEFAEFKYYIASNPRAGQIIRGTGGVRKVRWAVGGQGKSGGARVIYYYHNDDMPLFLLTVYRKSHKLSLSKEQRSQIASLVKALIKKY